MSDPLATLSAAGVSVWLDDLSRNRIETGNLAQLIRDMSIVGVTTNPTIFQKALADSAAYDSQVRDLATRGVDIGEAVRSITATDVRNGCDILRPVYEASGGRDGRVSIEVDPRIGHDTAKTIAEARALWWLVDRPNLLIKIPATLEGLPAIAQAIAEGISVNVTLIFSLERYQAVLDAYLDGMQRRQASGGTLQHLESVASFFVSRVDTEIDARLDKIGTEEAKALKGKAAVANARLAYGVFEKFLATDAWQALEAAGGKAQRPLWASTGVKDPSYDDTMYVVDLVAPHTVNTMPEATLKAVGDHGVVPTDSIRGNYASAQQVLDDLKAVGIDYDDVVNVLEDEGVDKFEISWNQLIDQLTENLAGASDASAGPAAAAS